MELELVEAERFVYSAKKLEKETERGEVPFVEREVHFVSSLVAPFEVVQAVTGPPLLHLKEP